MTENEVLEYLNNHHGNYFVKPVTRQTLKRWTEKGNIAEWTEQSLDKAIKENRIPPKRGRPTRFNDADKADIITACESMPQGKVAKMLGCSPSYVSLVVRGLR